MLAAAIYSFTKKEKRNIMDKIKFGVVASRGYVDYEDFKLRLLKVVNNLDIEMSAITEIISGGAKGVDTLAKRFAEENNILWKEYLPDYKQFGKQAALQRNTLIVEDSDVIIAFWDGHSRGTKDTIKKGMDRPAEKDVFIEYVKVTPKVKSVEKTEVKEKKAAIKGLLKNGEKGYPLEIENKTILNPKEANEFIIELLKDKLEEYNSEKYENVTSYPLNHTTVKLKTEKGVHHLVFRINAYKDSRGIFRSVSFRVLMT